MRIEIQRDLPTGFKVVTVGNGGPPAVMHGGLANFSEARDRAMSIATYTGWQILNRVENRAQPAPNDRGPT